MHTLSFYRIAVVVLALGTASLTAAFAQTPLSDGTDGSTTTTPTKHFHHGNSVLTADERAELKKDYQDALANPDIKTASDNLKTQEKALREQAKALHEQIHSAIIAADPSAEAIFAKLKAANQGKGGWHHHHGDKPADTSTTTDTSGQ